MDRIIITIIQAINERKSFNVLIDEVKKLDFSRVLEEEILIDGLKALLKRYFPTKHQEQTNLKDWFIHTLEVLNTLESLKGDRGEHYVWETYLTDVLCIYILRMEQAEFNEYIELEQQSRLKHYQAYFTRKEIIEELNYSTNKFYQGKQFVEIDFLVRELYDGREFTEEDGVIKFINPIEVTEEYVENLWLEHMENAIDEDFDEPKYTRVTNTPRLEFESYGGASNYRYQGFEIIKNI